MFTKTIKLAILKELIKAISLAKPERLAKPTNKRLEVTTSMEFGSNYFLNH